MERLEIDEIDQKGAVYLSSIVENFPALKELDLSFGFDFVRDDKTDAFRDFIDPNFKVQLPEAAKKEISVQLQMEIDQQKQLETFAALKNLDCLEIHGLNQKGLAYLSLATSDLLTAKRLEISFKLEPYWDNPVGTWRYDIDLDFKLPLQQVEEIEIHLQPEFDQEKQLRMFAPMNHFKHLRVFGLNRAGATYLNSIAKDLPVDTRVQFGVGEEKIELLRPMKR